MSFSDGDFRITGPYITRMRETMIHRGPDGAGTWVSENQRIGLGHRRLSIIDLSDTAAQPMSNDEGSLQLVFNGEIYNHAEIRAELEKTGRYRWQTDHSDTEVILHAYAEWGHECVHRFRGMFAIALWDASKQELWLVRDRMGVKPLYYSVHHGRIVFASEIKALLEDPEQPRGINEEGFFNYLTFLFVPAPQTLFEGIYKLPNASWMRVSANGVTKQHQYWDMLDHRRNLDGLTEDEIAKQLLQELRTAVRLRKVSDVPVGVFLSGGIDSSANAVLFAEGESSVVKTFSIAYDSDYASSKSELAYARQVADHVGAVYHERRLDLNDLLRFIPQMVYLQDEPIADPVCVPVYYVSKLARENGVIVCQVGEGADELFCGYPSWKSSLRAQELADLPIPRFLRRFVVGLGSRMGLLRGFKREYLRRDAVGTPIFWGGASALPETEKFQILSARLRSRFQGRTSWDAISHLHRRFRGKRRTSAHLDWMTYLDLNARLPELLLMRVDKMSMGVSLEGRVPFLDHKFVEFAMSIPAEMKTRNGTLKYMLKKSIRGLVPDEIIDRKKQGFSAPIQEWIRGPLGQTIRAEVRQFCEQTDLLDWPQVEKVLRNHDPVLAWTLFNVAVWWRTFIDSGATGRVGRLLAAEGSSIEAVA